MKIWMFDNCAFKFSQMIGDYWRSKGHDVRMEMGSNPQACEPDVDLIYIDWMDQNFYYFFNGPNADQGTHFPKKRIAVRTIDIDIWQGRHRDPSIWKYLDDLIVINQFYFDMITKETAPYSDGKIHLIRPGVDMARFTLKENRDRGYKIAMVTGNIWEAKGVFEGIRIFQEVARLYPDKPWELHIRGQHIMPEWHQFAYDKLIENTGMADRIHIVPQLGDLELPIWYATMDYILVTSHKEAFSYAAAEGMAAGLKPVLNNWFGSEWPDKYRFNSIHEAVEMIGEGDFKPLEYRQYIEKNYDLKRMLQDYDQLFQT